MIKSVCKKVSLFRFISEGEIFMIYGYARVSTVTQAKNGNSLDTQEQALIDAGCTKVIKEVYTGTKTDRPQLTHLISNLNSGDTLVVAKLDRFARTAIEGVQRIKELMNKGVKIHILNMGLIEDTPIGRLILNNIFAYAEFERDIIVERTQEGRAKARQNPDYREGRPKVYGNKQINHALKLLESYTYKEVGQLTGISKSTLIRAKKEKNNYLILK